MPGHECSGRLAPQGRVRLGERTGLFDDLLGGTWQLISRHGDPRLLLEDDDAAWFRRIGGVFAEVSDSAAVHDDDGAYRGWFDAHGCEAFLARPDFYVYAAGAHTEIPRFLAHLRRALAPTSEDQGE
jgi:hypothetical protein